MPSAPRWLPLAGTLIGLDTNLQPTMGFIITVKAFAAVVLGGLGSVPGAIVGAFLIGIVENLGVWFIPPVWKDTIAYGILILMLFFRPAGLFGKKEEAARRPCCERERGDVMP